MEGMQSRSAARRRFLPSSPFNKLQAAPEIERFAVEDRVSHDTYGLGRVVNRENEAVTVDFGTQQVRIGSPFNKLTKL
jgi:hypothetical protein